jgi:hypothetical protein
MAQIARNNEYPQKGTSKTETNKSGKQTKQETFTYTPKTSHKHIHKHQQPDHKQRKHTNDETATSKRTEG